MINLFRKINLVIIVDA